MSPLPSKGPHFAARMRNRVFFVEQGHACPSTHTHSHTVFSLQPHICHVSILIVLVEMIVCVGWFTSSLESEFTF